MTRILNLWSKGINYRCLKTFNGLPLSVFYDEIYDADGNQVYPEEV